MLIRIRPSEEMLSKLSALPDLGAYKALREDMSKVTHRILKLGPFLFGERSNDYTWLVTRLGVEEEQGASVYEDVQAEYAGILNSYIADDVAGLKLVEVLDKKGRVSQDAEDILRGRDKCMPTETARVGVGVFAVVACIAVMVFAFIGSIEKTCIPEPNPIIVPDEFPDEYPYLIGLECEEGEA